MDRPVMRMAIPQDQVLPSAHDKLLMKGSKTFRKRTRVPKIDPRNPCCAARQLTDEYASMRMNRNPRLFTFTQADVTRSNAISGERETFRRQSDVKAVLHTVLHDAGLGAEASAFKTAADEQATRAGATVSLKHLDARLKPHQIPQFAVYTREITANERQPTYGHRPGSAGRIFNPLSRTLTQTPADTGFKGPPSKAPGMSVAQLRGLLGSEASNGGVDRVTGTDAFVQFVAENESRRTQRARDRDQELDELATADPSLMGMSIGTLGTDTTRTVQEQVAEQPRREWDGAFGTRRAIEEGRPREPPPRVSTIDRDLSRATSFPDKIQKFRKHAAGRLSQNICEERQQQDDVDSTLPPNRRFDLSGLTKQGSTGPVRPKLRENR